MTLSCPHCSDAIRPRSRYCPKCGAALTADAGFRRWHREMRRRQTIFCAIAIPIGLAFLPVSPAVTLLVSGLGALGVVIGLRRLAHMPAE